MTDKDKWKQSNIQDLWDNIKCASLCIHNRVSEGRKRKGIKNWFEKITSENFLHPKKNTVSCIATIEGPKQMNPSRPTSRHIRPSLHLNIQVVSFQRCQHVFHQHGVCGEIKLPLHLLLLTILQALPSPLSLPPPVSNPSLPVHSMPVPIYQLSDCITVLFPRYYTVRTKMSLFLCFLCVLCEEVFINLS